MSIMDEMRVRQILLLQQHSETERVNQHATFTIKSGASSFIHLYMEGFKMM